MAYGLQLSDGRIADPFRLLTSNIFDLGDLAANFGDDVGFDACFRMGCRINGVSLVTLFRLRPPRIRQKQTNL